MFDAIKVSNDIQILFFFSIFACYHFMSRETFCFVAEFEKTRHQNLFFFKSQKNRKTFEKK